MFDKSNRYFRGNDTASVINISEVSIRIIFKTKERRCRKIMRKIWIGWNVPYTCLFSYKILIFSLLLLFFLVSFSFAQQNYILFTTEENFNIDFLQVTDENVVNYTGGSFDLSSLLPAGTLPNYVSIDALGKLSANDIVISLDEDAVIDSVLYADEDLIKFNGSTFSLWWDGSAFGLPESVNLDAVHVFYASPQNFMFSLSEDAILPGTGYVADEDLIQFSNGVFTKKFDGSYYGIPREADVDAAAYKAGYIISLDSAVVINGTLYDDADLFRYTGGRFIMFFDASEAGLPEEININAVEVGGATDVPNWMVFK